MPRLRLKAKLPRALRAKKGPKNQAEKVTQKFGGPIRLAKLLNALGCKVNVEQIRKWAYPADRTGQDGFIPGRFWPWIFQAARIDGLVLSSKDVDPRMEVRLEIGLNQDGDHVQAHPTQNLKTGIFLPDDEINFDISREELNSWSRPWVPGSVIALLPKTKRPRKRRPKVKPVSIYDTQAVETEASLRRSGKINEP